VRADCGEMNRKSLNSNKDIACCAGIPGNWFTMYCDIAAVAADGRPGRHLAICAHDLRTPDWDRRNLLFLPVRRRIVGWPKEIGDSSR